MGETGPKKNVQKILEEYIIPNSHLLTMERIHQGFFNEDREFTTWNAVRDEYKTKEWTADEVSEFAKVAKRIVESGSYQVPETYFHLNHPDEFTLSTIEEELERTPYDDSKEGEDREGFDYEYSENGVRGRYVYADVDTELSYSGNLNYIVQEGAIEFSMDPEKGLLILHSTKVTDVQKIKSIMSDKTNFDISVCGPLTSYPQEAKGKVLEFCSTFPNEVTEGEPSILQINELRFYNPRSEEEEQSIKNINFEGRDIVDLPEVESQREDGRIIIRAIADLNYDDHTYEMTVAGTGTMGYAKLDGVRNFERIEPLMTDLRERYLEHLAF
ncbi:hypothetical protein [Natrinema pallidum]|uniref:Uncharacterized protein n=1 Tax=Natrinema pallidum TaxID=69527 RepID=A0A4P9TH38_9EURY|nr:hypothetical protein [Natrinema pallidum]QCW04196.1 hypothetical protein FGF80_13545 [Natrinema pallidum]